MIYPLLSNQQLTIRENAKKALIAYHVRSPEAETLTTLNDIVQRLQSTTATTPYISDPYEAEGLVSVCAAILRTSADGFFNYDDWLIYLRTFMVYLSHPASTVRQEMSIVFRYVSSIIVTAEPVFRLV